jgi:hypothetical protein
MTCLQGHNAQGWSPRGFGDHPAPLSHFVDGYASDGPGKWAEVVGPAGGPLLAGLQLVMAAGRRRSNELAMHY